VQVTITAAGEEPDGLRSLRTWLLGEKQLRGRVRLVQQAPPPGSLGALTDALVVTLAPGGAVTALAAVLIAWLRYRKHDAVYEIARQDGTSVKVSVAGVREADAEAVRQLVAELSRSLEPGKDSGDNAG
jgi:hypothetical protein